MKFGHAGTAQDLGLSTEGKLLSREAMLDSYGATVAWVRSLGQLPLRLWLTPLAPDAWSMAESLAHLLAWDRYFLEERLPAFIPDADLPASPGKEQVNTRARAYARSGISRGDLIQQFAEMREQVVDALRALPDDGFTTSFSIAGERTTLQAYVGDLIAHDHAHRTEIEAFVASDATDAANRSVGDEGLLMEVVAAHTRSYANPIAVERGERVSVGRRDTQWPGWVWCVSTSGRAGWLPEVGLAIDGDTATTLRAVDTIELSVAIGERLHGYEQLNGWVWCVNSRAEAGWVPLDNVQPACRATA